MFCVNTLYTQQTIILPPASVFRGANFTIKDISGNASISSILIYTGPPDTFENSTNTEAKYAILNNNYGAVTFTSDGFSSWMVTQHYISSLVG
jgi:hypothetical protein